MKSQVFDGENLEISSSKMILGRMPRVFIEYSRLKPLLKKKKILIRRKDDDRFVETKHRRI